MIFFLKRNSHPEGHRLMPFGRVWAGHLGVIIRAGKKHVYEPDRNMHQLSARHDITVDGRVDPEQCFFFTFARK